MRRVPTILLALLTILVFSAAQDADAGWLKMNKESGREHQAHRFDRLPTMSFYRGTINEGLAGNWELDGKPLDFAPGCTVTSDEATAPPLNIGSKVVLMGTRSGDMITARWVLVQSPDHPHNGKAVNNPSVVWSTSDPTVGVGGPPEF